MITIQLKIHMYRFVLGQTNDKYMEIYNSSSYVHSIEAKRDNL